MEFVSTGQSIDFFQILPSSGEQNIAQTYF